METTRPKLEKFSQEFGDSTTLFKAVALKTHTGMVELEVKKKKNFKKNMERLVIFFFCR